MVGPGGGLSHRIGKYRIGENNALTSADASVTRTEAVYFVSEAGAKVFSAGTIRWPWGLAKPGFEQPSFQKFNRNLVLDFLGRDAAGDR